MQFSLSVSLILTALLLGSTSAAPAPVLSEVARKAAQGLRLLSIEEGKVPVWRTEDEKLELMRAHVQFFDVTDVYEQDQAAAAEKRLKATPAAAAATAFPSPSHQTAVKSLITTLSTANMQSNLATLSAYNNRYYKSSTGAQASTWILNALKSIASSRSDITVTSFAHSWGQNSVIARIPGTSNTAAVTILGAHLDSINLNSPTSGRAPGSDDDGSGTVNVIEIFRSLVAASYKPTTPVEFHFYSGEEGGLLGSQAVASSYNSKGTKVKAMMELDMTAYFKPGTTEYIALEADYVDSGLNSFIKQLASSYSKLPVTMDTPCGYACSDHASWYKYGIPTTMPFEAVTGNDNQNIHSASDTTSVNGFSWSHSLEFAKVGLAYVYELTV